MKKYANQLLFNTLKDTHRLTERLVEQRAGSNNYEWFLSALKRTPDLKPYDMGLDAVHEWRTEVQKNVETVLSQLESRHGVTTGPSQTNLSD